MPGTFLHETGARADPSNATREGQSDALRLMTTLASTPGVAQLAERARDQLRLAYRELDRAYPKTDESPIQPSSEPEPETLTGALERLLTDGTRRAEDPLNLCILALLGTLQHWPQSAEGVANLASELLWVESESRLPILSVAVEVLDDARKSQLAGALRELAIPASGGSRGQKCLALMWSQALSGDLNCLRTVLGSPSTQSSIACQPNREGNSTATAAIRGRLLKAPRGPFLTALSAFTGWMLLQHLISYVSRYVLGYRAQAELSVSERGIEIREQISMLGRKLRERTRLISLQTVRSLSREVRYARAGMYAGLAALALGSFIGMRLFVDGLRAPGFSGPTMLLGLFIVLVGLGFDFAFANWFGVSRAQCRLSIETFRGRGLYLTCDEPARVDGVLLDLASRLTA
jgi:hypothetical protein